MDWVKKMAHNAIEQLIKEKKNQLIWMKPKIENELQGILKNAVDFISTKFGFCVFIKQSNNDYFCVY